MMFVLQPPQCAEFFFQIFDVLKSKSFIQLCKWGKHAGISVDNGCLRLAVSEEENMDSANTVIGGLNDLVTRHWSSMQLRNPPGLLKDNSGHRRVLIHVDKDANSEEAQSVPILPWLTPDGGTNSRMLKALSRRVMGMVMLNPGVTEVIYSSLLINCWEITKTLASMQPG
jgi:hypothetical protein